VSSVPRPNGTVRGGIPTTAGVTPVPVTGLKSPLGLAGLSLTGAGVVQGGAGGGAAPPTGNGAAGRG
jgi:hypothetical protein